MISVSEVSKCHAGETKDCAKPFWSPNAAGGKGECITRGWSEFCVGCLTLWVLVRAVDIVASHNNHGELEALLVGVDQHFCRRLARSVGVGGCQDAGLQQVILIVPDFAVDLVGGDVDEALDPDLLRALQQHVRSIDVRVGESV